MSETLTVHTESASGISRRELANAIRALSMDAVQRANSGHPGAPMGMADFIEVLWRDFLRHNPNNPAWVNRDRFVLSNGHGSMLLYAVLHLTGYELSMDDIKRFRQLGSKTPGHPEYRHTPGVETTTGPLGQGLANAVGMALAERKLAAEFNCEDFPVIDHYTYVCVGDGCLMEGISHEACSLAGTLGLGKLVALYDDNGISIDGEVSGWFTDDTAARFAAYGWHVIDAIDGHDPDAVAAALTQARAVVDRPSLLCCRTIIGWGSPSKQGTAQCHGSPLGEDEIRLARERMGWTHPPFVVPPAVYAAWNAGVAGAKAEADWLQLFERYRQSHPGAAKEFDRRMSGELPGQWKDAARACETDMLEIGKQIATRKASELVLEAIGPTLPELIGGSADLTGSNNTLWSGSTAIDATASTGNYLYYGVREFGMSAIMNGMALHGGLIPYGGTFLVFSDYARNALRMAALMGIRSIFVLSHDSIGLGEDGPTHQPIEHAASLRLIPHLAVWRPCDAFETAVAWRSSIERQDGPSCLLLTRQGLEQQTRTPEHAALAARGGYVLLEPEGDPQAIVIATGSEVSLAVAAACELNEGGARVRVVSMPCCEVFEQQTQAYRDQVLPPAIRARVAVEAGSTVSWHRYVGLDGEVVGLSDFGTSAPGDEAYDYFGLTVARVRECLRGQLG